MDTQILPSKKVILSPKERRDRNREEMRSNILAIALEIMHKDGAGALNLNEIARRLHLRPSSLYVYFDGKMAIYDALYALGIRIYHEGFDKILQTIDDPWEALQAVIERAMDLSINNPELFHICFERPVPGFVPSAESLAETDKMDIKMYLLLNRVVPAEVPDPSRDVPPAHGLFIAMWHGLIALHLANDPEVAVGNGRFGSLIPAAMSLFKTAWSQTATQHSPTVTQGN